MSKDEVKICGTVAGGYRCLMTPDHDGECFVINAPAPHTSNEGRPERVKLGGDEHYVHVPKARYNELLATLQRLTTTVHNYEDEERRSGVPRNQASLNLMKVREVLSARDGETAEQAAKRVVGDRFSGAVKESKDIPNQLGEDLIRSFLDKWAPRSERGDNAMRADLEAILKHQNNTTPSFDITNWPKEALDHLQASTRAAHADGVKEGLAMRRPDATRQCLAPDGLCAPIPFPGTLGCVRTLNHQSCYVIRDGKGISCSPTSSPETASGSEQPTAAELLRQGGEWLGAARKWLQWNTRNGDQVTWGSGDLIEPQLSVRQIEDLASEVAAAAMRPQPSEERLEQALKARWTAEAEVERLKAASKP